MGADWQKVDVSDAGVVRSSAMGAVFLQMATAAMLGGVLISACTAIAKMSYDATLATGICGVAYVHYTLMSTIRWAQAAGVANAAGPFSFDQAVALLRYSDWVITMPLLVLKILDMARDGTMQTSDFLENQYIPTALAALAVLMVACGYISSAIYGEIDNSNSMFGPRIALFIVGLACMSTIYVVLFFTALESESKHVREVFGFSLWWCLYPAVYLADLLWALKPSTKDIAYSILDIVSKPFLALYIVVQVFGVA
jgi:bacteriorhodopsin